MGEDMNGVRYEQIKAVDQSSLRQRLNIARSNGEFTDVRLRVDGSGKVFEAHRVVLAAASEIINTENDYEINGLSEDDMEDILTYIYLGCAQVPCHRMDSFLKAAKTLGVFDLQNGGHDGEKSESVTIKAESVEIKTENSYDDSFNLDLLNSIGEVDESNDNSKDGPKPVKNPDLEDAMLVVKVEPSGEKNLDYSMIRRHEVEDELTDSNYGTSLVQQNETATIGGDSDTENAVEGSKEKPFACSVCCKAFRFNSLLKMHERSHTGEKPFSCDTCGKAYRHKSHLKVHENIHTGEKTYPCNFCDKKYIQKGQWKSHERIHTGRKPFPCNFCGKTFRLKSVVKIHERIHTGEEPFSCSECGKTFKAKVNWKKHKRVHNGEKPFVCLICKKAFKVKLSLMKHQERHTYIDGNGV